MDKTQALKELKNLDCAGDIEMQHHEADSILLALIDDEEITNAYDAIDKWYA